jgi:hypothetical protein
MIAVYCNKGYSFTYQHIPNFIWPYEEENGCSWSNTVLNHPDLDICFLNPCPGIGWDNS